MSKSSDLFEQAFQLHQAGRIPEAIELYNKTLQRLFFLLGTANQEIGKLDLSVSQLRESLALDPAHVAAHNNLGNTLKKLNRIDEALASYDAALALDPDYARAHYNRGNVLRELERLDEAAASYGRALAIDPDYAEAYRNRGVTLHDLKRFDEALADYASAIALKTDYAEAHCNRGVSLLALGRHGEALEAYDRALALKPDYAEVYANRGIVLHNLQRLDEALDDFNRALALNPDYAKGYWNKAILLLQTGDFLEGWRLFEWRLEREDLKGSYDRFPQQLAWRGQEDIRGKRLLIHTEQGFGDVIQFVRYVPQVRALGARIILEVQGALAPLVATLDCEMTLVERGQALPAFDAYCPVMSLPHVFRTTKETVPAQIPYLFGDPDKVRHLRSQLGSASRTRVGLAWSGSPGHNNDGKRSIALQELLALLDVDVQWHSLQMEYREHDLEVLRQHPGIHQHHEGRNDFSDTAALIECMDLVITVDTSFAHVAGALGKPVWILLPFDPDYRWMLDREDSPWYPTARLFRQPAMDDWKSVIRRVAAALRDERSTRKPG